MADYMGLDDVALIAPVTKPNGYRLTGISAVVWTHLKRRQTLTELVALISETYHLPKREVSVKVRNLLRSLEQEDLVDVVDE